MIQTLFGTEMAIALTVLLVAIVAIMAVVLAGSTQERRRTRRHS